MRPPIESLIRGFVVACAVAALAMSASPATAQDDSGCTLPPLTLPLFDATPPATIAATPVAATENTAVDEDEIVSALETIVACANDSNPAIAYAIFTPRYLAEQYADPTETYLPEFERFLAVGQTESDGSLALESASIVTVYADGRVVVEVGTSNPTASFTDIFILANIDGVWLIDGMIQEIGEKPESVNTLR